MTTQVDYTTEEWTLLVETPYRIAEAVMLTGKSGGFLGALRERQAVQHAGTKTAKTFPQNALIQAVAAEYEKQQKSEKNQSAEADFDTAKGVALEDCRKIAALLEQKHVTLEALEYKRWLILIAEQVADAASEGGLLGISGTRISPDEQKVIQEIADGLQVQIPF